MENRLCGKNVVNKKHFAKIVRLKPLCVQHRRDINTGVISIKADIVEEWFA